MFILKFIIIVYIINKCLFIILKFIIVILKFMRKIDLCTQFIVNFLKGVSRFWHLRLMIFAVILCNFS